MEVSIIDLDHKGRGIGRINNKVVFIPNTIPNEVVDIKITRNKKNFCEGEVVKFIEKNKNRVQDVCQYYPICGGCQLLHLPYKMQLEYKENKIKNIFKRYGLDETKIEKIIGSPSKFNYRNKIKFHIKNSELGFFEDRSNKFIKIDKCLLANEKINDFIKHAPTDKDEIIIRSNNDDITFTNKQNILHKIGDYQFLVSTDSFFQINDFVTPLLYNKIKDYLGNNKINLLLDLYCGTGTIGIYLSELANKVIGIEINPQAINDAIINSELNKINNIEFICGDVGIKTQKMKLKPECIIVDPPRSGLDKNAINTILNFNPQKIIYVSCDPMTLVRDLNILNTNYEIIEVTPFDMFPNTYHLECCCLLFRKDTMNYDI